MFKKLNGRSLLKYKVKLFVVSRDEEKYLDEVVEKTDFALKMCEPFGDEINNIAGGKNNLLILETETNQISSLNVECSSIDGDYYINYDLVMILSTKTYFMTRNGRNFTGNERAILTKEMKNRFLVMGETAGAIYLEMHLDGEKSVWFNPNSTAESCELPLDELAARKISKTEVTNAAKWDIIVGAENFEDIKNGKNILEEELYDLLEYLNTLRDEDSDDYDY